MMNLKVCPLTGHQSEKDGTHLVIVPLFVTLKAGGGLWTVDYTVRIESRDGQCRYVIDNPFITRGVFGGGTDWRRLDEPYQGFEDKVQKNRDNFREFIDTQISIFRDYLERRPSEVWIGKHNTTVYPTYYLTC